MADYQIQEQDVALLRAQGMAEGDLEHSILVAEKALEVARRTGADIDMELVGRGGLFHDLGKVASRDIDHGILGAKRGEELGLPAEINLIMEKHIRGGLTESEAVELGLPVKDYTLHRLEERIIIYADRLADIIHDGVVEVADELEAETRFEEIVGTVKKYGKTDATRDRYLGYHAEIQGLIAKAGAA